MHDGRFMTLKEVINHYTDGIQHSETLSQQLKEPIELSSDQKVDLISFLLTLNDKEFLFDKKHLFKKIEDQAKEWKDIVVQPYRNFINHNDEN